MKLEASERRTPDVLRQHYEVEKELANRLRKAGKAERRTLYAAIYDELLRRVPYLTQTDAASRQTAVAGQIRLLKPFLKPNAVFLEVGAGDCALCLAAARFVKQAYALEVCNQIGGMTTPGNFRLVLSDGTSIDVPDGTVDVAYSSSVIEHVHPEDASQQLREIYRVLKPGGMYLCVTPNRLSGPHDISRYFDPVATGMHLKEYLIGELADLYREAGFGRIRVERVVRLRRIRLPVLPFRCCERILEALPSRWRQALARSRVIASVLTISLAGRKAPAPGVARGSRGE